LIVRAYARFVVSAEFEHICSWASLNNLRLNTSKSRDMIIRRRSRFIQPQSIEGVERVKTMKVLGVVLSEDLSAATHSFIPFIHSGHFYSIPSSPLLPRGASDYSTDTVSEFHAEAHRQLQVKDFPKVSTWWLERESNPRKSSSQPRRHHVPQAPPGHTYPRSP